MRNIVSLLLLFCLFIIVVSGHHRHDYYEDPVGEDDEADNRELINNKIMLFSMVFFSLILVLVVFSHYFYSTCVHIRRQSRRREAINRVSITLQQLHLTEPPTAGLDVSLIAALPVFVIESKPQEDQDHDVPFCAVCLSDLEEKQVAKLLPNCNHSFHVDCIDTWLGLHTTCPLCRAWVQPRLEPQNREGPAPGRAIDGPQPSLVLPISEPSEGTSEGGVVEEPKIDGLGSQLSSFRRVRSMERSSIQAYSHDVVDEDLERQ